MGFVRYISGCKGPSGFGSSSTAEKVADGISLDSYTAIVTGATSGIGFETARVLVKQGSRVIIPARKLASAEQVREIILKEFPGANVIVLELDLGSFASVRKFAANFKALNLPLNILINNAGIVNNKFVLSEDGLELVFATNHMGHFLLVELLMDDIVKTAENCGIEGRIVNVSSSGHTFAPKGGIEFDKINDKKIFGWARAYGQSKLANILHVRYLTTILQEKKVSVTANAVHPGPIHTNISRQFNTFWTNAVFFIASSFLKNAAQGAATTIYAATNPSLKGVSGKYFSDCNESDTSANAKDMKLAKQLWNFSCESTGVHA